MTCRHLIAIYVTVAAGLKAAHPATIYANANTGNDSWSGLCRESDGGACGPKRTVEAAVAAALANDTIILTGTFQGPGFLEVRNRPLNLVGEACIILGGSITLEGDISFRTIHFEPSGGISVSGGGAALISQCTGVRLGATKVAPASALVDQCDLAGFAVDGNVTMSGCTMIGRTSPRSFLLDGAVAEDCTFEGNSGDGLSRRHVMDISNATLRRCAFVNNRGFGIAPISAGSSIFQECVFDRNSADDAFVDDPGIAGACYARLSTFDRCTFRQNIGPFGGALQVEGGSLRNSIFVDNISFGHGGAVYEFGLATIVNCTFVRNRAFGRGGALYSIGTPDFQVLDSIIAVDNEDAFGQTAASQLDLCCGSISVNYSLVEGWLPTMSGTGTFAADPGFVDSAGGDFRLIPASPCIDTGNPFQQAPGQLDLDGAPRVMGGRVDIGAFEFTAPAFVYGDANCDGVRDNFDIDSFVLALLNKTAWEQQYAGCLPDRLDTSANGAFNNFDIDPFVDLLIGSAP